MERQRPIGWWVKRLDRLLEQTLDSGLATEGLTRRHWQVLHSLAEGAGREEELRSALADFAGDVGAVVDDLVDRGWARRGADGVALTAAGRSAHERVATAVGRVRRLVAEGVSAQEYEQTIGVLSRMVGNLERALGRAPDEPRR
ncbi:MarR family winged helix-turn-helix transcriptional regulator [Blastococcus deserti]|uniref:MarR family winged helix-turn-helix transcriptional regulator n=1 Tax=Blastococcus deserti TaxID=2259033 RepID=A0ABW4XEZ8_9ACTN